VPAAQSAYGGVSNGLDLLLALQGGTPFALDDLQQAMPAKNMAAAASALTIQKSGVYYLSYAASYSYTIAAYVQFYVTRNNAPLPETLTARDTRAHDVENVAQTALVALKKGDKLQLVVQPNVAGDLFLPANATNLVAVLLHQP
jgi:hypothetical protein